MSYSPGDKVRLRSGGPVMCVGYVDALGSDRGIPAARCYWITEEGRSEGGLFPFSCIEKVEEHRVRDYTTLKTVEEVREAMENGYRPESGINWWSHRVAPLSPSPFLPLRSREGEPPAVVTSAVEACNGCGEIVTIGTTCIHCGFLSRT